MNTTQRDDRLRRFLRSLRIYFHYLIPSGEKNPPVVIFDANRDLDEDGNVEFNPILPRTEKARVNIMFLY